MKVSVIVSYYKNLETLGFVLESLKRQIYKNFEVVIAEDDNIKETVVFLQKFPELEIIHLTQEDKGNNKIVIQNKAIAAATGEYLIFIDGDMVMFKEFILHQLFIAKKGRILSGRRVHLSQKLTEQVKRKELDLSKIEKYFYFYVLKDFLFDKESRWEQGVSLNPKNLLYKLLSKRVRNAAIIGCNWSCYKEDFVYINGFNEEYGSVPVAMDTDLTWRFIAAGYELFSSKNLANCFHLHHKVHSFLSTDRSLYNHNKKNNLFICENGTSKYMN